ncbi:MAG: hypothetical protein H0X08_01805 [Blastocatellia bacterium]|nr:hypothetical protein [Blastocatellia bacterium]
MAISLAVILIIAFGGLALTYLDARERPLMWRLAAGNIIGCAIFGTSVFVVACLFALTTTAVLACLALTLLPVCVFARNDFRTRLARDWQSATGKLQGASTKRFSSIAFYGFFLVLFWLFFGQSMYETTQGIFTGGSQNLGDLPYHLGAIYSFTDGNNFPPQNPSYAGARFSYPFVADLLTAAFMRLGADIQSAIHLQNFAWAFSLLVILERFVASITQSRLAGRITPFLLFFSGGLGFLWFASDYWHQGKGLWEFIWSLPRDYTIGNNFRWGNSMVVLFMTQRSLLLGMPLTILVLGYLWNVFLSENEPHSRSFQNDAAARPHLLPFAIGLLAGTLPLIHLHSLAILFVVAAFLFAMRSDRWKNWIAFGIGTAVIAIPELIWSMSGTANRATEFIGWNLGWDNGDANLVWFWIKNTGLVFPALVGAIWLLARLRNKDKAGDPRPKARELLLFYLPFAFLFVVSNVVRLAPWEWDNIKILIYWYVPTLALIAYAVAWVWVRGGAFRIAAIATIFILCFAGGLDVWRTVSSQNRIEVFNRDAVRIAEQIRAKTAPDALFLNAPTYNPAVVLSGRRSYMRYTGHLLSHGIDYLPREDEVKRIYSGAGVSDILLRQASIDYVLVSPEERNSLGARDEFFKKYPLVAESGEYRVYKIK